jgi:hypothetical protein
MDGGDIQVCNSFSTDMPVIYADSAYQREQIVSGGKDFAERLPQAPSCSV